MELIVAACVALGLACLLPSGTVPLTVRYRRQAGGAAAARAPGPRRLLAGVPVERFLALLPRRYTAVLQLDLHRAQLAGNWSLTDFVAVKLAIGLGLVLLMALYWWKTGSPFFAFAMLLQALAGWTLPDFFVKRRAVARAAAAERELATMLANLAICLQTGLSLRSALLQLAVMNPGGVLGYELRVAAGHLSSGATPREALTALMERCHSPMLVQALSNVLQHADASPRAAGAAAAAESRAAWQRMKQRAERIAHTTSLKLFFPQLLLGLPALLLVVMGPAALNLWRSFRQLAP
jgi:tight adherence protein C